MKGNLTISRPSYGNGKEKIRVCVRDKLSFGQFLEIEVGYSEFTEALTGMAEVEMDFEVFNIENVGKIRVIERRQITYPGFCYDRTYLEDWLRENGKEDGWTINPYLSSQGSLSYKDNNTILHYKVYKYLEQEVLGD